MLIEAMPKNTEALSCFDIFVHSSGSALEPGIVDELLTSRSADIVYPAHAHYKCGRCREHCSLKLEDVSV